MDKVARGGKWVCRRRKREYPPGKSVSGSLRGHNHSHKPESRDSKTISILMAGSSVNPFISVGQICIISSLALLS